MKKLIALSLLATFSTASIAAADDVTIVKRHTNVDPGTTGSVVIKERRPDVVKKTVIIKKRTDIDDGSSVTVKTTKIIGN